jgi:hypothetical protein
MLTIGLIFKNEPKNCLLSCKNNNYLLIIKAIPK